MPDIVYAMGDRLYLNITNRCTNHCDFCIKNKARYFQDKYDLWLEEEPTVTEVLHKIRQPKSYSEIVFCGYGEPLLRLEVVKEIALALRKRGARIRIDTDGLANLYYNRNVLPQLKGAIDSIIVSLNAHNSKTYYRHCKPGLGPDPFGAVLQFIEEAKKWIPAVSASVVDIPDIDLVACRSLTDGLGVSLIIRPYYSEMYKEKKKAA